MLATFHAALIFCRDDIAGRLGFTCTGFLAAFAMLYVVASDVPKLDKMTVSLAPLAVS